MQNVKSSKSCGILQGWWPYQHYGGYTNLMVAIQTLWSPYKPYGGHTFLNKFCAVLDLPEVVTIINYNSHVKKTFNYCSRVVWTEYVGCCKTMKYFLKKSEDRIVDVVVTGDGTWWKRYGHNSTLGVTFAI